MTRSCGSRALLCGSGAGCPHACRAGSTGIGPVPHILQRCSSTRARRGRPTTQTRPETTCAPGRGCAGSVAEASSLLGLLLDASGELGDLVEDVATLGEVLADATVRVHDGGVVAAAELLPDL